MLSGSPWQNPLSYNDIHGDGMVTPADALVAINSINTGMAGALSAHLSAPTVPGASAMYIDANGDGSLSPADALTVINAINRHFADADSPGGGVPTTDQQPDQIGPTVPPLTLTNGFARVEAAINTSGDKDVFSVVPATTQLNVALFSHVHGISVSVEDATGAVVGSPSAATGSAGHQPVTVNATVTPGTTYYLVVSATAGTTGNYYLQVLDGTQTPPLPGSGHGEGHGDGGQESETTLTAALSSATNPAESGAVSYQTETEDGQTQAKLIVSVSGAPANATLQVTVSDLATPAVTTTAGQIKTDASGNGQLVLSSNPRGSETALPSGFPTLAAGFSVTVGTDLTGTLAAPSATGGDEGDHDGDHEGGQHAGSALTALLTSATNTSETGAAIYKTETENGQTSAELIIAVKGGPASTTLNVTVADPANPTVQIPVGQIQTDASGNGVLVLSTNPLGCEMAFPAGFPTLTAGFSLTVGTDLTGMLAVPTPPVHGGGGGGDGQGHEGHGHGGQNAPTVLTAMLTSTTNTGESGTVIFEAGTQHGQSQAELIVFVKGAAPNASLNVTVTDSASGSTTPVAAGTLTTDANGHGRLVLSSDPHGKEIAFPANFPSLTAGFTVAVGTDLTGTLAVPSPPTARGHDH
jgi:hypothetical protein